MAEIIEMPKLSDTMTVGTLVRWLKNEGDKVETGDMLAEVETDKATMELECFFDGTLLKIFRPAGSQVPIGVALCAVGKPGEKVEQPAGPPAPAPVPAAAVPTPKPAPAPVPKAKPPAAKQVRTPAEIPRVAAAAGAAGMPPVAAPAPSPSARIRISPLARKLAAEHGVDPSRVAGSGPGGRIVRADILAAVQAGVAPARSADSAREEPASGAGNAPPSSQLQEDRVVPVSNMRATVARRLVESKTQVPHFYVEVEVDAEPLLALRSQINASFEKEGVKLSVNDFILKAAAEALRNVPAANASWEEPDSPSGMAAIHYHASAHVSFAVALEDGLITPVIRDAQAKTLLEISTEAKTLTRRAKEKKLAPAEFTGGTFCVSNLGMMGVDRFSAIINPPNAAILAVGATVKKPVVKDDKVVVGHRMTLTLSCDHRVVDGAIGACYLAALKEILENPTMMLL
jgi:pyruvate dehydrogenase E2 component (dihydrolipoamide acetyltransferase)